MTKAMLCRCEDVTVREVEEAFRAGHSDLESVKRYTGLGTGWCQGKQCVVPCARFIADRTGSAPRLPITPRPPLHPVPMGFLAGLPSRRDPG